MTIQNLQFSLYVNYLHWKEKDQVLFKMKSELSASITLSMPRLCDIDCTIDSLEYYIHVYSRSSYRAWKSITRD